MLSRWRARDRATTMTCPAHSLERRASLERLLDADSVLVVLLCDLAVEPAVVDMKRTNSFRALDPATARRPMLLH